MLLTTFTIADGDVAGLASAIVSANTDKQVDTIVLASGGKYDLTTVDNMTNGPNGLPVVTSPSLTIQGNGSTLERSEASDVTWFRLLDVAKGANLTIDDLALKHGFEIAILSTYAADGGTIYNEGGNLTLNGDTVQSNSVIGSGGFSGSNASASGSGTSATIPGGPANGGEIYTAGGVLTLVDTTVASNDALGGGGGNGGGAKRPSVIRGRASSSSWDGMPFRPTTRCPRGRSGLVPRSRSSI